VGLLGLSEQSLIIRILQVLRSSEKDLLALKRELEFQGQLLPALLWLYSMNFVSRKETSIKNPVIRAKWKITDAGRNYLMFVDTHPQSVPFSTAELQVLLVAPDQIRKQIKAASATDLSEALADLLASAKDEVLISSPYIDEVIVPLIHSIPLECSIKILTEKAERPLFTRLIESRPSVEIRVLRQLTTDNVQLFQVHAKFVIVDGLSAIVTSANLNERSLYYNIEIGVLISKKEVCKDMTNIFNTIFESAIPIRR
jgi:phosphatidylserine/phosphatidylglycerophosphate/cardiolipin synthase-like enzyme